MLKRPRRLRTTPALCGLVRETRASKQSLILPLFVCEGHDVCDPIDSLVGHRYYSADNITQGVQEAVDAGVTSFILFGLPDVKDEEASGAFAEDGVVQEAVRAIKSQFPHVLVMTDVCLCEYTSHGHCGILKGDTVDNDKTLPLLAKVAVSHARAGADVVAPSDMMDGRVLAIREALDKEGFYDVSILSYSAKYASSFYGPFREVAQSAPSFGNRKAYQMDWHNSREAQKEVLGDIEEGADMVMVKPALSYLDIVREVKANTNVPVCVYSVSGEYAMIKAAVAAGLIDEYGIMCETAISMYRAGADMVITYYAKELAQAMEKGDIG